jgi:hypothetical protein
MASRASAYFSTLKMEAICSSETSVNSRGYVFGFCTRVNITDLFAALNRKSRDTVKWVDVPRLRRIDAAYWPTEPSRRSWRYGSWRCGWWKFSARRTLNNVRNSRGRWFHGLLGWLVATSAEWRGQNAVLYSTLGLLSLSLQRLRDGVLTSVKMSVNPLKPSG